MNLITPPATLPAMYRPTEDRALGDAGHALRNDIQDALRQPVFDRGNEIFNRLSGALGAAMHEDGTLTTPEAFGRALELLSVLPNDIPLPHVVVESENEIGLDWDEGIRRVVSLTVRDNPMIGFAALFGAEPLHGRMEFAGNIPQTLEFLFMRLFPRRAASRP